MFEELDLDNDILRAVTAAGFSKPTSIQSLAIPEILDGRDVLASAPTGTGKTAAFILPSIQHLLDNPRKNPGFARVLILAPTRELAYQIYEDTQTFSQYTDLRLGVITGGINYGSQKEIFEKNNDILIATPGRLLDYMRAHTFHGEDVEILILDEADRMLDMGFRDEMELIVDEAKHRRQSLLFSATLEGTVLSKFAEHMLNEPVRVDAEPSRRESAKIHQWIHLADSAPHKRALLEKLLAQAEVSRAIVFVKTREGVQQITSFLQEKQMSCSWLQGEMPQDKRNTAVSRFKNGQVRILVATDIAARGLDVDDVSHVINFDMPRKADIYVHRIGRTGRAGKKGIAISLVEAHDMGVIGKIERYTEQKLKRRTIAGLEPKHKEAKLPKKSKTKSKSKKPKKAKANK